MLERVYYNYKKMQFYNLYLFIMVFSGAFIYICSSIKTDTIKSDGIKNGRIKNGVIKSGEVKTSGVKNIGVKNSGIKGTGINIDRDNCIMNKIERQIERDNQSENFLRTNINYEDFELNVDTDNKKLNELWKNILFHASIGKKSYKEYWNLKELDELEHDEYIETVGEIYALFLHCHIQESKNTTHYSLTIYW